MKTEKYTCDINNCKNEVAEKQKQLQIIFLTDQTEGRGCKPYLTLEKIDICQKCLDKVLEGEAVLGTGAQGHNQYFFKTKE